MKQGGTGASKFYIVPNIKAMSFYSNFMAAWIIFVKLARTTAVISVETSVA